MRSRIDKRELAALYKGADINVVWWESRNLWVIDHPKFGPMSPNAYRAKSRGKPCPFCGQKMMHGPAFYTTRKQDEIAQGYQYTDENGNQIINKIRHHHAGYTYFHSHYVTLDHKLNKARCPERMFDADNLDVICWKCNNAKSDNNAYELRHRLRSIQDLAKATLDHYPIL